MMKRCDKSPEMRQVFFEHLGIQRRQNLKRLFSFGIATILAAISGCVF